MTLIVSGASGFVGRALLESLPSGTEAVALARKDAPGWADRLDGVSWVSGDLRREGLERGLPGSADAVVHLAQSRLDDSFPEGALDMVEVNVAATARLLDYARRAGARRFVLASTATVYEPQPGPLREDSPLDCSRFYAASKRSAELIALPYGELLSCWVLRIFTVYGPGQSGRLIPRLIDRVRSGEPITLGGGRGIGLSPIYVGDLATTIAAAAARDIEPGRGAEIVNVAGAEALRLEQIATEIGAAAGREPLFERAEGAEPGGWMADTSKLASLLAPDPARSFGEGIVPTVAAAAQAAA